MGKDLLQFESFSEHLAKWIWIFIPKVVIAIFTLIIGFWVANHLSRWLKNYLTRKHSNPDLIPFLSSLTSTLVKAGVLISVAAKFGIETTSFIAILGGIGVALGLALQGNLSNFASGVMILFFKPYRIGDTVMIATYTGVVKEILIFNTVLTTADNKLVYIPNNTITSGAIVNISGNGKLRGELTMSVSGKEDIFLVKDLLISTCSRHPNILQEPTPWVSVDTTDSNVSKFTLKFWVKPHLLSPTIDFLNEEIKTVFTKNQIGTH